ncbi:MAG: MBL fold metallo-hydrolase [Bdellovibrionaceae bacterium]|nr:MBL fold metallo-hydrolase [Pseudobdellovibrionaceae bacterium]MBX3034348.1 MBL fold metallo-hydrolase [Pseudobdellovibrionaceae bacterium]
MPSSMQPGEWSLHFEGLVRGFFSAGHRDPSQVQKYFDSLEIPIVGGYGASTTCVEVETPQGQLIIDGGSGIRQLSERIMSGTHARAKGPFHIYMTHFHWDHVIGLPFFTPHFLPNVQVNYYAVHPEMESLIRGIFRKPYFPVPFESLPSKIRFHTLEPRQPVRIDDMTITPYQLDHPDPCWGLKVEYGGKAYAHCVDTEGTRVTREDLGPDLPLYQNIDLMYYDAQYTFPELADKANWGHSAAQIGLDIAFRENVKHMLFAHHDPGASIQTIQDIRRQTQEYYSWRIQNAKENGQPLPPVKWGFAYEGLEVKL